jgi:anti-anti-sigma factor
VNITKTGGGGHTTFALSGRLDTTSSPKFEAELIPEFDNSKIISLDFKEVDYVSSAGLRVLLLGEKKAKAVGGKMSLFNVSPDVMDVFDLTGFTGILNVG